LGRVDASTLRGGKEGCAMAEGQRIRSTLPNSLGGDWTNAIVYVGNTVWDGNQFASQHVAGRLAERTPVLYVDPPLSVFSGRRDPVVAPALEQPHLRMVRPGLARLTPVAPPGFSRPLVRDATNVLLRRTIRRAVARIGAQPTAMVAGTVRHVLGAVRTKKNVYYATDDFSVGAALMGLDVDWVNGQLRKQLTDADLVITVSEHLAAKCREQGISTTFIPNGCDAAAFADTDSAPWPTDVTLRGPIAGFVGYLSARIDLNYLEAVADRGISVLLVGSRQLTLDSNRMQPLLERPNVQWVGPKSFAELPSYLRVIDVGMVPYADSEFNRASFPLKTLEYLAAGRGVVSTDLPSVRWLDTELVDIRRSAEDFARAVDDSLKDPRPVGAVAARQAFAATHSWDHRAAQIATLLGLPDA
jgi:glycosyltransferase involved in cell wall biosynthesis